MAAAGFAIELPTNRQSRYFDGPGPNVHDPNYIPVLNGADPRVDFSQPSFSALPSIPTPHKNESQTSLKRSKSASAPETVVHNHAAHPMPSGPVKTLSVLPQEIGTSHLPDSRDDACSSSMSVDNTTSSSDAGTPGPVTTVLVENVFVIPGNSVPKVEEIQFPPIPASARSSISSTRKIPVPTSKYSKKNHSIPSLPSNATQVAQSPLASRGASPDIGQPQAFESARSTPVPSNSADASPMVSSTSAARLQARQSTASERRARALHSHPSNMSMKSRKNSTVEETDELPLMSQNIQPGSRASSTRSRTQSLCNSIQPTPAPDAPLPDLPAGAKRPPTREKPIDKPIPQSTPAPASTTPLVKPQNDHVEMSEFMTTQKTTVFRRFDEVHVRLLLHLQDEISSLEKSLKEIEDAGPGRPDQIASKATIMQDLRKVLAEYGELPWIFLTAYN